jgi:predicted DNA-binding antitoxin AbrB/MazE fold protein
MYLSTEAIYENGVLRPTIPLAALKDGQHVTVVLYDEEELRKREREFIEEMRAEGRIVQLPEISPAPPTKFEPIKIQGKPLSETILEERR